MIRVLFVDDEPDVLEGLENRLRALRNRWQLSFARSGDDALAQMQQAPVDVVISDMRMPGMDGASLLRAVRERHPQTVRFILSGESGRDDVLRALPVAHQFLTKPCDARRLQAAVHSAIGPNGGIASGPDGGADDDVVRRVVASIAVLPALPRLYWDLAAEIDRREPSLRRVSEIIEQDVAMTARVLQVVNSAFFGLARPVSSTREAVNLLGLEPVRALVLTSELFRGMSQLAEPQGLDLDVLQAHAMRVATLAGDLVDDRADRATAMAAGLLHDIGHMVLALSAALPNGLRSGTWARTLGCAAERLIYGCTHAEVGGHVLALWGLPPQLVDAVSHHHEPSRLGASSFSIVGAVHVADWLTHRAGSIEDSAPEPLDLEFLRSVNRIQDLGEWQSRFLSGVSA